MHPLPARRKRASARPAVRIPVRNRPFLEQAPMSFKQLVAVPVFYRWAIAVLACVAALLAHAGEPQAGIAGIAGRKATVNFTDLSRQKRTSRLSQEHPKSFIRRCRAQG